LKGKGAPFEAGQIGEVGGILTRGSQEGVLPLVVDEGGRGGLKSNKIR